MLDDQTHAMVTAAASRLFADIATDPAADPWPLIVEQGFHLVLVPESLGGLDLGAVTGAAIVRLAAANAIRAPLGETMVGNMLLGRMGVAPDDRVVTLASSKDDRIAWGAEAARILVDAEDKSGATLGVFSADQCHVTAQQANLADAPRARCSFAGGGSELLSPGGFGTVQRCGAALRTIEMAGAAQAILDLTVDYIGTRQQFGRALSKFQAIQQELARMAGQVAALDGAAGIAAQFLDGSLAPSLALAAAKARASEGGGVVAAIAHQAHGAIGFTEEYRLGRLTKTLWSWRAEFGGAAFWQDVVADVAFAAPADNLWRTIVAA